MSEHDPQTRLLGLGVFILPLLLVKGAALMMDQPPRGAAASGIVAARSTGGVIETYTPDWSLDQIAAAHRVEELRSLEFGESPLLHARRVVKVEPVDPVETRPVVVKPPDVAVQMILRSRRGNVALIDGKRYRVGDPLGTDGWIVQEIDADSRSVLIAHPESGQEAMLMVPMP